LLELKFHHKSKKSETIIFSGEETNSLNFFYGNVEIIFRGEEPCDEVSLLVGEINKEIRLEKQIEETLIRLEPNEIEGAYGIETGDSDNPIGQPFFRKEKRVSYQRSLVQGAFINNLHWGDFQLTLRIDSRLIPIGKIRRNRIIGAPRKGGHLKEILEVVFGSPQNLIYEKGFISNERELFSRGHRYRTAFETLVYQREMLEELRKWNKEELRLPERVVEDRRRVTYTPSIRMDSKGLRAVASNPSNFYASSSGQIDIKGQRFSLSKVDQLEKTVSFDTHDSRLLVNTALDIRNAAARVSEWAFDHQAEALDHLNYQLGSELRLFCSRHKLAMRNTKATDRSTLMRKLIRCKRFVEIIEGWIHLRNLDPLEGESTSNWAFPLNSLEKLWEFFCLERIVQSLEKLGLDQKHLEWSNKNAVRVISLRGRRGKATIFYEPKIWPGDSSPIINLQSKQTIATKISGMSQKNASQNDGFEPDYIVVSTIDGLERIGILDAKFSPEPDAWAGRTYEIIDKYCPWLRKPDGQNLDYYVAMVPSVDHHNFYSMTHESFAQDNFTQLGCLAVRMRSKDTLATDGLASLFTKPV